MNSYVQYVGSYNHAATIYEQLKQNKTFKSIEEVKIITLKRYQKFSSEISPGKFQRRCYFIGLSHYASSKVMLDN
jgi:hypothetical protein